jgi:hypothetical protein
MSEASPPTLEQVAAIAALSEPVARNHRITHCYHELALALRARTGPVANWCCFATWASRQAGQSIRGEDLREAVARELDALVGEGAADALAEAVRLLGAEHGIAETRQVVRELLGAERVLARTSDAVARGNLKVFAEIGREFARFLEGPARADTAEGGAIDRFAQGLRPGPPPDGQDYLRLAFRHYHGALLEPAPARRAQLMLLANLEVGFHEQTRLQPEIAEAVDAAVLEARQLVPALLSRLLARRAWLARTRRFFVRLFGGRTPLDLAAAVLVARAKLRIRRVITEHLMTLTIGESLRLQLGSDLRAQFPPALARLEEPELLALLARIDPTPDSTRDTGARDWADLAERMHYIADLFRCCQELDVMFDPPLAAGEAGSAR